jgi:ATP diphosphatase
MSDTAAALQQLLDIMAALRDPASGCPWDLKQDFASIAPHTLEEVYEVIDAIEQGEPEQLKAELGDLLFQIVFYARLGEEQGRFSFGSIAEGISRKLLERHPHVFPAGTLGSAGSAPGIGAEQVAVTWEQIKQAEREQKQPGETSVLDDVPLALPAMLRAAKLQKRAAHVGFDWKDQSGVLEKVREELGELDQALRAGDAGAVAEEFGDLLFSMVNLSRHLALNSETALRQANRKFERRFRAMEALARAEGNTLQSMDAAAQERLWQRAKAAED